MKRVFDFFGALVALIVLAPVLIVVAVAVRIKLGSPVVFWQQRPGLNGRIFSMLKFRTMTEVRGSEGGRVSDEQRLTAFGRMLRASSLDELPELWNVVRGDMSLVGPRPLLVRYLDRYTPEQARRHEVRPGITGWAQVNGRNAQTWEQRFALDVWYVDNRSFLLDLKILCLTVWKVIARHGISDTGEATKAEFMPERKGQGYEPVSNTEA